jgi:hypothetical protein
MCKDRTAIGQHGSKDGLARSIAGAQRAERSDASEDDLAVIVRAWEDLPGSARRGEEEIRVIRRDSKGGQATLYWKVEPNARVGHPGQLAYRLDTWVIKRRLDQLPRPLPRLIRIGDLRQIARDLDLGGDTNAVKRAFEQNASAFIRAKLAYRSRDGREDTFEGYFIRARRRSASVSPSTSSMTSAVMPAASSTPYSVAMFG